MHVDAANVKSFPGEPTTNLVPNPDFSSGTTSWGTYTTTPTVVTVTDAPRTYGTARSVLQCVTSATLNGGGNYGGTTQTGFSFTAGLSYTVSYYARSLSGTLSVRFSNQTGSGDESNLSHDITVTDTWTKFTRTVTLDLAKSQTLIYNKNGSIAGATFQIADMQIEQKAYATNFVNGTRGTTVATGGGWGDLTKNVNHGALTNGPSANSANGGSIVFDGINDYALCANSINVTLSSFTAIAWAKHTVSSDLKILSFDANNHLLQTFNGNFRICTIANGCTVGTATINDGTWKMLTTVGDATSIRGYINDNATPDITQTTSGTVISGQPIIAATLITGSPSYFFNGNIALVSIYNRALSTSEIKQNYEASRTRFNV